ncbi:PREDICTED: uncharacterized protein LOC105560345 [Vollenhovia emeryi]|uniref:uncharacterized protein LOC105560345 n=1 Tax=Vollenhovia emeryi TaxID=411798 RepID=UPI0005F4F8B6|nr:PREDICTED: uncharacterized protein LOC105560345 [Vollenhovia emeryi]
MTLYICRNITRKLDKLLKQRINIMPSKPPLFPLQSIQQVKDFDNISQEEYENVVQYLHFIGGYTLHEAIKYCMKEAVTDETINNYSVWGEQKNIPLFDTKLMKAVYDAVCLNSHFANPLRDDFFREVAEAIRIGKQRHRNIVKRGNKEQRGRRQRLRHEAENYLCGEPQNAHNVDDADDDNYN